MKKIKTLLPKDPNDLSRVIDGTPTVDTITHFALKIDGTSCMIKDGIPYGRYDVKLFKKKRGKVVKTLTTEEASANLPEGAIACQEPDEKSGHWPHWIPLLETDPSHQYMLEGFNALTDKVDGTYECIGPKIQNNPHNTESHIWVNHRGPELVITIDGWENDPFNTFKKLFEDFPWEGLVAYNGDEPVAKIRRVDFGYEKTPYNSVKTLIK